MGKLVDGRWVAHPENTRTNARGEFVRGRTTFRDFVTTDGSSPFAAEAGRYHLFVAYNCPWAHRTLIARRLKGLTDAIGVHVAHYRRNDEGWWYKEPFDDYDLDENGQLALHRLYSASSDDYSGSATVPILWDRELGCIVSNESAEIIRMFNDGFGDLAKGPIDLYPEGLREEIDAVNAWVYSDINNGVYRCGFARTQEAYEAAFVPLFKALDEVEARLGRHRYLAGDQLTEADVRLFPTLARFDPVYYSHFKCNQRRIKDYPSMSNYFRELYQMPAFKETVRVEIYKRGYYGRSPGLNPRGIVPMGPALDWDAPHDRASRGYKSFNR